MVPTPRSTPLFTFLKPASRKKAEESADEDEGHGDAEPHEQQHEHRTEGDGAARALPPDEEVEEEKFDPRVSNKLVKFACVTISKNVNASVGRRAVRKTATHTTQATRGLN